MIDAVKENPVAVAAEEKPTAKIDKPDKLSTIDDPLNSSLDDLPGLNIRPENPTTLFKGRPMYIIVRSLI